MDMDMDMAMDMAKYMDMNTVHGHHYDSRNPIVNKTPALQKHLISCSTTAGLTTFLLLIAQNVI